MSTLREAAQQALEALEATLSGDLTPYQAAKTSADLRAALAAPEQEPVLVVEKEPDYWTRGHFQEGSRSHIDPTKVWGLPIGTKLYAVPPQRRPLTDEEIHGIWSSGPEMLRFARAIEAAHGIKEEK